MAASADRQFHCFPNLPTEIRLKIWNLAVPPRIIEIQLPSRLEHISSHGIDLRPYTRPYSPILLRVCRESRIETFRTHQPCPSTTFSSPYPYPYDLVDYASDTLFVPITLYSPLASEMQIPFSSRAAQSMGLPRDFILDRMAANPADVANIQSLAVCWADMHVKDVNTLREALRPYKALRQLMVVDDLQDIRLLKGKRGKCRAELMEVEEGSVRGRYLERVLEEYVELVGKLNDGLRATDAKEDGGRECFPSIKVMIARFVE
jgi:hypothetical protein